jgi:hypothetical protein
MIAGLLNTLVGLWLAYAAVFPHATGVGRDRVALIAAIAMLGLSLWMRRSDAAKWHSTVGLATGTLLALLTIADQLTHVSDVLMFWGVLWAGLVCATVSLWAALYRPPQDTKKVDSALRASGADEE